MDELRRLRKENKLSQAKLAALADLDPSTVNQIETGVRQPNTRTLEKLARVLGVEVVDFFPKAQPPLPDLPEDTTGPKVPGAPHLEDLLRGDGRDWHEALRDSTPEARADLLRQIDSKNDRLWAEFQASTDPAHKRTLEQRGRKLLALEAVTKFGPSAVPVREREFV